MNTSLFSLIFAGVFGVGTFAGTLQQNVLKTEKPYIDKLFHEIERDIRDFARDNPITNNEKDYIKGTNSLVSFDLRKKRNVDDSQDQKSENTLEVWTDIWVGLLSDYISNLWMSNNKVSTDTLDEKSKNFSNEQKQEAIKCADISNKDEKERFKTKLDKAKNIIESIYEKMKDFILKIEFPENYKYNTNDSNDGPYENYIRKISQ